MADFTLLPDPTCLHLLQLEAKGKIITATVTTTAKDARCPLCTCSSEKVHSRYVRVLADLAWMNCVVRLELHTRRFFCLNADCQRKIFTKRLPHVVAPYAHKTLRLTEVLTLIGFALGGEAGKRLAQEMGMLSSPDTLLRLLHTAPLAEHETPCVPTLKASRCTLPTLLNKILITRKSHSTIWEGLSSGSKILTVRLKCFRCSPLSKLVPTPPLMDVLLPFQDFTIISGGKMTWLLISMRKHGPTCQPEQGPTRAFCITLLRENWLKRTC